MTEWFKKIVNIPLQFGLTKINSLVSNSITLIFNLVGNRLFKMDNNKIIKNNECTDDKNFFYFYPLILKEFTQDFFLNTVKLISGNIDDLIISVPWRTMLSDKTVISIGYLKIDLTVSEKINVQISNVENSYFYQNSSNLHHNDLSDAYTEIYNLLVKYFHQIKIKITVIEINLSEHLQLIIDNLSYDNDILTIDKISVYPADNKNIILAMMENIIYEKTSQHDVTIDNLDINHKLIQYLPKIYMEDNPGTHTIKLIINRAKIDLLNLIDCHLNITPDHIQLVNIKKININQFATVKIQIFGENVPVLTFNYAEKKIIISSKIKIRLKNIGSLIEWTTFIMDEISHLNEKILYVTKNPSADISNLQISNLSADIIIIDDVYSIQTENLIFGNKIILENIIIRTNDTIFISDNMVLTIDKKIIELFNFNMDALECVINAPTIKIIFHDNMFDIIFTNAYSKNIIIHFLTDSLQKMNVEKTENNIMVNLQLIKCRTSYIHQKNTIDILVGNGKIFLSDIISANDTIFDILLNNYHVAFFNVKYLSSEKIIIKNGKLFIDPQIFDKLNYLIGTLPQEESVPLNDKSDEIINALNQSSYAHDFSEFEKQIDQKLNSIQIEKPEIIENYVDEEWEEKVGKLTNRLLAKLSLTVIGESLHIYFFDKISARSKPNIQNAFLCGTIDKISINKYCTMDATKYIINIKSMMILDNSTKNPKWYYFCRTINGDAFNGSVISSKGVLEISLNISPVATYIREETLIRLLAFFSNSYRVPPSNSIYIKKFNINDIYLTINFCPMILKNINESSSLTLHDFKIKLSGINTVNVDGFSTLINILSTQWKKDLNIDNILQFIPNIKIIKPYAKPLVNMFGIIFGYFKYAKNQKKIRALTKHITKNTDLVSNLIKIGINHIYDLFK